MNRDKCRILEFAKGIDRSTLSNNIEKQSAIVNQVIIICELFSFFSILRLKSRENLNKHQPYP